MSPAQLLFKRALQEKLDGIRKQAFVPAGQQGPQATGPGGAPVGGDPMAGGAPPPGGAPMDPMAAGGMPPGMPPMDPAAAGGAAPGGMPPMDPAAMGGMPPTDPMAAGAPPVDPAAAGGAPPADPMADPMAGMPPPPTSGGEGLTKEDADVADKITQRTIDTVRQTLEMVGKAKTKEERDAALSQKAEAAAAGQPETTTSPITGQPGFDPAMFGAPGAKTASVLAKAFGKTASKQSVVSKFIKLK